MIDLRAIQRTAPLTTYVGALVATATMAATASGIVAFSLNIGAIGIAIAAVATALAVVGATAISLAWWRSIDEAAREAHKWAWWWGGTAGALVGGLSVTGLLVGASPDGLLPGVLALATPVDAARLAIMVVLLFQAAGYGVAWAVWWLARTRG